MTLGTSDYTMLGVSIAAAILGSFGGFSGALAFLAGICAAVLALRFGWPLLDANIKTPWLLAVAALSAALVVFGLARFIVKKTVNHLLAQPADAIFGALTAAVAGFAAALAAAYACENLLDVPVDSVLLRQVLGFIG